MTVGELKAALSSHEDTQDVYLEGDDEIVLLDSCESDEEGDLVLSPAEEE